jgi:hypothetical protein
MGGCATGPLVDDLGFLPPGMHVTVENPLYLPLGPTSYGMVFEKVLSVVGEYFEIRYSNRYDGQIITFPRVSPGLEQPWKPGSPDLYQRLEATLQSIRHRTEIQIEAAQDGGFFVSIIAYKELEDIPRPIRATCGSATFRSDNTVERQFEVIDPMVSEPNWIPLGRDSHLEQAILQRLKKCL